MAPCCTEHPRPGQRRVRVLAAGAGVSGPPPPHYRLLVLSWGSSRQACARHALRQSPRTARRPWLQPSSGRRCDHSVCGGCGSGLGFGHHPQLLADDSNPAPCLSCPGHRGRWGWPARAWSEGGGRAGMSPSAFPCGTWGHLTSSGGTGFPFTPKRPVGGPACQSGTFIVSGRCELFPKMSHHEDKGTPSCLQ
uniref:Uncharacterized protein n=1 Tax=Myotis myotis TaxID=51298 RepID=A0A7J7RRW8_MYOMY|nr:hypothetical protein mMyoMyo1_010217 [Myotis myotis]